MSLSNPQMRKLKALAQRLDPVVDVVKAGVTDELLAAGDLAAVGVDGEGALVRSVRTLEEGADLPLRTDSRVFQARHDQDRVAVVELGELHILWAKSSHFVCSLR